MDSSTSPRPPAVRFLAYVVAAVTVIQAISAISGVIATRRLPIETYLLSGLPTGGVLPGAIGVAHRIEAEVPWELMPAWVPIAFCTAWVTEAALWAMVFVGIGRFAARLPVMGFFSAEASRRLRTMLLLLGGFLAPHLLGVAAFHAARSSVGPNAVATSFEPFGMPVVAAFVAVLVLRAALDQGRKLRHELDAVV